MVAAKISHRPVNFLCLTNDQDAIAEFNWTPLKYDLPGWWSKLELFREDLPAMGKILYLDLDVFLVDSINELLDYSDLLMFAPPISTGKIDSTPKTKTDGKDIGKTVIQRFQSSAICWSAGDYAIDLMKIIDLGVMDFYRGDQDFFGDYFGDVGKTFPIKWFDKIKNCYDQKSKPDLKVVLGNPKRLWNLARQGKSEWINKAIECSM
jgi:hypothetical protein